MKVDSGTVKLPERQINGSSYICESKLLKEMAGHTGQSSQLFPLATDRNAQFLATVARSTLVRQVDLTVGARDLQPTVRLLRCDHIY